MADVTIVKKDVSWLKQHERIVIVALVLLSVVWLVNKWLDRSAANAEAQLSVLKQQIASDQAQNAQIATQNAQIAAQYQAMVQSLSQQNAALASAVVQRNTTLSTQQTENKSLPLPDLEKRWETLADLQPTDVTVSDTGITVNNTAAVQTVNLLEELPIIQSNLADETKIAQNVQQELTEANSLISSQNTQIAGLNKELTDEKNAHKADVVAVKAEAKKSKRNWFIRGVVTGAAIAAEVALHL